MSAPSTTLTAERYRAHAAREGARLVEAAELDLSAQVPRCPGWSTTGLLDHVAGVLRFVTSVVVPRSAPVGRPDPRPDGTDPVAFCREALDGLVAALEGLDPDEPVWNWSTTSEDTGAFWLRRMAQELLVHRLDAERAVGDPTPVDPELAGDGVDELLHVFLPRVQGRVPFERFQGSLLLERTDGTARAWRLTTTATTSEAEVVAPRTPADATARGRAEDLLLALWGRQDWDVLELDGAVELFAAYAEEVRP